MISTRTALTALAVFGASATARADVVISTDTTQNMNCLGGVCAPTARDAVLNVTDLENLLASGNVEVTTKGSGVQAKNIDTYAVIAWSTGNGLRFNAHESINVHKLIAVNGSARLSITTEKGKLQFGQRSHITFANLSSTFTINGISYQLEDSIASLATAIASDPSGTFALANDYDASGDGTYSSSPIQTTFYGTLECLGNKISHLSINSADYMVGLFSFINGGTVANLRLSHVHVMGSGALVGGLAGEGGVLVGDAVSGIVESTNHSAVGGLVGAGDEVISSHSTARAIATAPYSVVGSLVGQSGIIIDSYATGDAIGGNCVGGLIGDGQEIENSFASGAAKGTSNSTSVSVGGLAGCADGTISNSYATGKATAKTTQTGHVKDGGPANVGGLVGYMVGTISSSYSTGAVRESGGGYLGGLCGFVQENGSENFSHTYWDTTTSGITNSDQGCGNTTWPGITGLKSKQLQSGLPAGFHPKIWAEKSNINNGLPYLIANPPPK